MSYNDDKGGDDMNWNAKIILKSGRVIDLISLKSIDMKSQVDSSVIKNKDFDNFQLPSNRQLSFVGEKDVILINSNDIEYVSLHRVN